MNDTPKVSVAPPGRIVTPRKPAVATTAEVTGTKPTPEGWWSIRDLEGSREKVLAAIDGLAGVPEWGKAVVKAAIAARPAEFNYIYADAHFTCGVHQSVDNATLRLTVQGSKALI